MKPKLLMIYLLRSSAAALATHSRGGGGVVGVSVVGKTGRGLLPLGRNRRTAVTSSSCDDESSSSSTSLHATLESAATDRSSSLLTSGHIAFRLARRTDVPQIQKCNLATLPENYNANFYVNHMRTWPELTLVAEHIPEGCDVRDDDEEEDPNRITPIRDYIRGRQQPPSSQQQKPRKEIVGYILGKVEDRPINVQRQIFPPSRAVPLYEDEETLMQYMNGNANGARVPIRQPPPMEREKIGHVTSLAVHSHARRLGIASSLLHQLHYHLQECYGADSVGLHVRISNKAAVRLYCEEGYDVADIIPLYYGDGEDAYFMRKDLGTAVSEEIQQRQQQQQQQQNNEQRQWRRGEKERNEWLNRDATRSGSFFDGRKSMRDTLSQEERAWVNADITNGSNSSRRQQQQLRASAAPPPASSAPSLSGQFRRSFRTFFNGGEQMQSQRQMNQFRLPPWEVGPEGLRLPRYSRVVRAAPSPQQQQQPPTMESSNGSSRGGMSLKDLVTRTDVAEEEEMRDDIVIESSYEEEGESMDARVAASGSV